MCSAQSVYHVPVLTESHLDISLLLFLMRRARQSPKKCRHECRHSRQDCPRHYPTLERRVSQNSGKETEAASAPSMTDAPSPASAPTANAMAMRWSPWEAN